MAIKRQARKPKENGANTREWRKRRRKIDKTRKYLRRKRNQGVEVKEKGVKEEEEKEVFM